VFQIEFFPRRKQAFRLLLGGAAAAWLVTAPALGLAALAPPRGAPQPPLKVTIRTQAGSPPALSMDEALAQPGYPSSIAHYQALKAKAKPPRNPMPNWTGAWLNQAGLQFQPGYVYQQHSGIPLKPEYEPAYQKKLDDAAVGKEWDPLSACFPAGYPRMMHEQRIWEFITTPKTVWVLQEVGNEARRIYTDGRGHPPEDEGYPKWDGDAMGFWDDDTLIVHTNNIMGTDNGYSRNGPPQSDEISTVEQWRMVDPDTIVMQMTIYDPKFLSKPWRIGPRQYKRAVVNGQEPRPDYYNCASAPVTQAADGSTFIILPTERAALGVGSPSGPPPK
jgi:hypothetical protein